MCVAKGTGTYPEQTQKLKVLIFGILSRGDRSVNMKVFIFSKEVH